MYPGLYYFAYFCQKLTSWTYCMHIIINYNPEHILVCQNLAKKVQKNCKKCSKRNKSELKMFIRCDSVPEGCARYNTIVFKSFVPF